jgi:hypothetical protein
MVKRINYEAPQDHNLLVLISVYSIIFPSIHVHILVVHTTTG